MSSNPKAVCLSSELDLFTHPPYQTGIQSSRWVEYTPTLNHNNGQLPIQIEIPGTKGEYIDLSNIYHYMRLSITKNDNTKITSADEIGPINYIHNTIFKNVDVKLNKTLVSMNCDYGYRAEIESHLNYNRDAKESHLLSSLWIEDDYADMDNTIFAETTTKDAPADSADKKPVVTQNERNMGLINRKEQFVKLESMVEHILMCAILTSISLTMWTLSLSLQKTRMSSVFFENLGTKSE